MVLNPLRVKICYKKMGIFQQNARAREGWGGNVVLMLKIPIELQRD